VSDTAAQVAEYASIVFQRDDMVEVRRIWPVRADGTEPHSTFHRACDLVNHIQDFHRYNAAGWGIYVGVNPRRPGGGKKAADVQLGRVLVADFDGVTTEAAAERWTKAGLPAPSMVVATGHGAHVYLKLADPVSPDDWERWHYDLIALVGSDKVIHDAPRVLRLPGFLNTKKAEHVPCMIVESDPAAVVELADLHSLIPHVERPEDEPGNGERPVYDGDDITEAHRLLWRIPLSVADDYDGWIRTGQALHHVAGGDGRALAGWDAWSQQSDKYRAGECAEKWGTFDPNREKAVGLRTLAKLAEPDAIAGSRPKSQTPEKREPERPQNETPDIVRMSDVAPTMVEWLWPNRIAIGKVTLIPGDPGLGKSFFSLDVAARVSTGAPWPDDPSGTKRDPGGVVLLSAEDDPADTIRPRLDAALADVNRIVLLRGTLAKAPDGKIQERWFSFEDDLPALEAAIGEVDDCRLVVVDPISSYMGKCDSHNNAEVRAVLGPLARLATDKKVAVVCITHLRKGDGSAIYRAIGSLAFVAQSRAAWCIVKDREDPTGRRRLMLPVKNNLAEDSTGLAYKIARAGDSAAAFVQWESEPVTKSVDEALTAPKRNGPEAEDRREAEEWLRRTLATGPRLAKEAEDEGKAQYAFSQRTIERARKEVGVKAYRPEPLGPWWWRLEAASHGGFDPND